LTEDSWEEGRVREDAASGANVTSPMPAIVEEIGEFARCIRTGESPEIAGHAALHNLAVVLAAVESDKLGRPVEIASVLKGSQGS
jgi:myo-inositol 2-dehydrogenase/D-chiro-inositol 1-dehydrogenase